jgi:hypothetical protein
MKRLVRAQEMPQHTPQEWLMMLFDKTGTPEAQLTEDPNIKKWIFKYGTVKPSNIRIDKWYSFLNNQLSQLSEDELKNIFIQKFSSQKNNLVGIEVSPVNILVFLKNETESKAPQKPQNFIQKLIPKF